MASFGLALSKRKVHSGAAQLAEATARDFGIWVGHTRHHATDACLDDCFGAGSGATGVAAGFEIDVERRATRIFSGVFESDNFRVAAAVVRVETFADDASIFYEHGADKWIGMGEGLAAAREFECAVDPAGIDLVDGLVE